MRIRPWLAGLGVALLVLAVALTAGPIATKARQDATTEAPAPIGEDEAAAIAREANPGAEVASIESEQEGDRLLYEVELSTGVEVEIDAATGEIIETEESDAADEAAEDDEEEGAEEEGEEGEESEDDEAAAGDDDAERAFTDTFDLERCEWSSTGGNPYFILEPGFQTVLQGEEDGETVEAIITVLDETETVDGVETRVVEERESEGGELVEVSRNFFAVCGPTNDVFYFGETVDDYEEGQVVANEGAWLAGEGENRAGLIMPARPLLGARYYQEIAPDIALDRTETIAVDLTVETPAGTSEGCFMQVDSSPLDPEARDEKVYCPDVGIVRDEALELVGVGDAPATPTASTGTVS